jgi:hypothetical protein
MRLPGAGPPRSVDPRSAPCYASYGPSSAYHRRRWPSPLQGRTWGRRLLSWRFHRPGRRPELVVVLQPLDRHHLHVVGSGPNASRPPVPAPALLTTLHAYGMPPYGVPPPTPARLSSRLRGRLPRHHGPRSVPAGTLPPSPPPIAPWLWPHRLPTGSSTPVPPITPPPPRACSLAHTHLLPHTLPRSSLETVPLFRSPL